MLLNACAYEIEFMKSALISLSMKLKQERYYSYSRSNIIIHLQDHYHCFVHSN